MIYIKLLLTAIFWGGTFIAGRKISGTVYPVNAAFLRFVIASIFLIFFVYKKEGGLPRLNLKQIVSVFLLGLTGVFAYNILFFSALKYIEAGRAALIIANNPIFISLLSVLIFKEKFNWLKAVGIGLSVSGAMTIISGGHISDIGSYTIGTGELMIFGCVFCWVSYSLIGKAAMNSLSPLVSVTYSSVIGAALLFIPALIFGRMEDILLYSMVDWASLFYLGFFGTVLGFFWYYEGIQSIGPMKAGVFINFVPVSAIIIAWFLLGETLTSSLILGGGMVVCGVYLTNSSGFIFHLLRMFYGTKNSKEITEV